MMPPSETPPLSPFSDIEDMEEIDYDFGELIDDIEPEAGDSDPSMGGSTGDEEDGESDDGSVLDISDNPCFVTTFGKHKGSVFCCQFSNSGKEIATGGEDDMAYVWNASTGEAVLECGGHKDSVISVSFSKNDAYLATADMSGFVQVWKLDAKAKVWEYESSDLSWIRWHPTVFVLLAGMENGETWMWEVVASGGKCKVLPGHGSKNECCCLLPDGKHVAVGYGDGAVKVWDLKGTCLHTCSFQSETPSPVNSMSCHPDGILVLATFGDGNARILNAKSGKLIASFYCLVNASTNSHNEPSNSTATDDQLSMEVDTMSIETGAFSPEPGSNTLVTGALNGDLIIWDVARQVNRFCVPHPEGIVKVCWVENGTTTSVGALTRVLVTASVDGCIRLIDERTGVVLKELVGHRAALLDMDASRADPLIVTASDDGRCVVFRADV